MNCFAKDATIFFPSDYGEWKLGKNEIEESWKKLFPEFVDKTKQFDLKIFPENMHIQVSGESAILTFQMSSDKYI